MTRALARRALLDALLVAAAASTLGCDVPAPTPRVPACVAPSVAQRLARAFGPWPRDGVAHADALAVRLAARVEIRALDPRALAAIASRVPDAGFALDRLSLQGLDAKARAALVVWLERVSHDAAVLAYLWDSAPIGACDGDVARHTRVPRSS